MEVLTIAHHLKPHSTGPQTAYLANRPCLGHYLMISFFLGFPFPESPTSRAHSGAEPKQQTTSTPTLREKKSTKITTNHHRRSARKRNIMSWTNHLDRFKKLI